MSLNFSDRLSHAWNAFKYGDQYRWEDLGFGSAYRPDRIRLTGGNEKTIVSAIYNRVALDVASVRIQHAQLDKDGRSYVKDIKSELNERLNLYANKDQTSRAFIQDVVMSMLDEGCVAIVPVDTETDPRRSESFKIHSMRTAKILEWYPDDVKVRLYNDRTGREEELTLPKQNVCIIENPLYAVVNERNSIMQRLIRKLNLLDVIDEQSGSGKLDLIIQLPYVIKTDARRREAEKRRRLVEKQLNNSKYGIAYTDGTERITQLNRPVENNLMKQIEYLTAQAFAQFGITQAILDGSASEAEMLNYWNRTIEPFLSAIVDEMKRKFLSKTARSQNKSIVFFKDPFKLAPVSQLAEIADKFTRNEIMTANEFRQVIGISPSDDPRADELRNKNISESAQTNPKELTQPKHEEEIQNGEEEV